MEENYIRWVSIMDEVRGENNDAKSCPDCCLLLTFYLLSLADYWLSLAVVLLYQTLVFTPVSCSPAIFPYLSPNLRSFSQSFGIGYFLQCK